MIASYKQIIPYLIFHSCCSRLMRRIFVERESGWGRGEEKLTQVKNNDDEDDDEAEEGWYHREDEYVATED